MTPLPAIITGMWWGSLICWSMYWDSILGACDEQSCHEEASLPHRYRAEMITSVCGVDELIHLVCGGWTTYAPEDRTFYGNEPKEDT